MKDAIELTKALVPLAWPLILAIVLWKLFPAVKTIANSRSFAVKIAGMELSVQDSTGLLRSQIEDLQKQVIELRGIMPLDTSKKQTMHPAIISNKTPVVLWVDDYPSNNAFEIAQLRALNIEIILALSTEEAISTIRAKNVDVVISDMGRVEGGVHRSQAGLTLLNAMMAAGVEKPFIIYSSAQNVQQNEQMVKSAGGDGATASPIELLEWLRSHLGLPGLVPQ